MTCKQVWPLPGDPVRFRCRNKNDELEPLKCAILPLKISSGMASTFRKALIIATGAAVIAGSVSVIQLWRNWIRHRSRKLEQRIEDGKLSLQVTSFVDDNEIV